MADNPVVMYGTVANTSNNADMDMVTIICMRGGIRSTITLHSAKQIISLRHQGVHATLVPENIPPEVGPLAVEYTTNVERIGRQTAIFAEKLIERALAGTLPKSAAAARRGRPKKDRGS